MPHFKVHLRHRAHVELDDIGLDVRDLHEAYLQAHASIPSIAQELLISGCDPMECAFIITDRQGRRLMEVPFTEVLSPSEWKLRRPRRRPHGGPRSERVRDNLALRSFRLMFESAEAACVLLTPELIVSQITEFGARQSHVDQDAVRGKSILEIFSDLRGKPKQDFTRFMLLAQATTISEVVDLPYHVLDEHGVGVQGWWNARVWPIFDDDDRVLGLVEWAEPSTRPTAGAKTNVRVKPQRN